MTRQVFYSFHYTPDHWHAAQIRSAGVIEGNKAATDHEWESVTRGGDAAIKKWIDDQLEGKTCTIVLVGQNTAGRKWINYEIEKSWNDGKGVLGINVHRLKDSDGNQVQQGANPFETFTMSRDQSKLSNIVKVYNPPNWESKAAYGHITSNLAAWIEEAISIRNNY